MSQELIIMGASGRMGKVLCSLAGEYGFNLHAVVDIESRRDELKHYNCLISSNLATVLEKSNRPVIIDFTAVQASLENARLAAKYNCPLVIGTTGFSLEQKDELHQLAKSSPLFWSSNMSLGISVLLNELPRLVKMLGDGYDLEVLEIHHNKKKDSPSGTALSLAESLARGREVALAEKACMHREGIIGERPHGEIGLQALRGGDVVGVHTVYFLGQGERIEITHQAHSRDNFAHGALKAAQWLSLRPASHLYSMQDIINETSSNPS